MAVPKIIPYDVELRSVNPVRSFDRPKAYTNDRKSVEFQFKILDMTSIELNTATAITLVYMRDGSFFANPSTDVERVGNVFSYLLKENEGNHAGVAQIQLVVTIDDAEFASQLFDFEIINGLETKVAQEVMIYDWTTLTRDARAYIDQFVADEVFRDAQFDNAQFDRNTAFVASQDARTLAFGTEQTNRGTAFTAEQTNRNTAFTNDQDARALTFSESESGRTTAESGRVTAEDGRVSAENNRVTKESQRVTAESSRVTAEGNRVTAESGRVTAESGRVTAETNRAAAFTAFNTRLTAEETATAANKISAVKGKTFADVDSRIEDVEFDTTMMATNLVTNGDFSNGTTNWYTVSGVSSLVGSVLKFTANAHTGRTYSRASLVNQNKYYLFADIATSGVPVEVGLTYMTNVTGTFIRAKAIPGVQRISGVLLATTTAPSVDVGIIDYRYSGWDEVSIYRMGVINLTATFGAGNEPTVEQMEAILAKFPNSWFDGTKNLFRASETLKKQIAIDARTEFEAKNEVVNGDFSNGTTGWNDSSGASTLSAASGVLTATGKGTAAFFSAHSDITTTPKNGDKIYTRARVRDNLKTTLLQTYLRGGYTSGFVNIPSGTGAWQTVSCIHTLVSSPTSSVAVAFRPSFASSADQAGSTLDLQYVLTINLTATFGAGKEPTLAEMDRLMARFPNSWFDGVKPIQTIETLYQEKANKVQEAWITPTLLNGWTVVSGYTVGYRKTEFGRVETKGAVTGGTIGTAPFAYLAGYRPLQSVLLSCRTATNTIANATISIGGGLTIWDNNNTVSLDGITFPTT